MNRKTPDQNKLNKLFGIGPLGVVISLFLLAVAVWADSKIRLAIVVGYSGFMKTTGIVLVASGLGIHFWSFSTLRTWWIDGKLCTKGPFKYFRHPMYAAWITFICPGIALYLNSWFYVFWLLLLHLLWHTLVKKEERIMIETFGDVYTGYASRTGRFFPKLRNYGTDD